MIDGIDPSLETSTRLIGEQGLGRRLTDVTWREMWEFYCRRGDVPGGMQVHRWHEQAKANAPQRGRAA